jgi:putative MATE family efflux protein
MAEWRLLPRIVAQLRYGGVLIVLSRTRPDKTIPPMRSFFALIRAALRGEEYDYTAGSLKRALVLLSIPMVLEMAMESLFALVDAYFVAKVSPDAVATVGLTESVVTLVYAVAIGISTAPVAMISRYIGQKDPQGASRVAKQSILLALLVSLLLGLPGALYPEVILRMMGGSEELIASGKHYTRIIFGGNAVIMLLFLLNGIFRGAGNAAHAMRALWIANGINIVLDPILIHGLGPIPALGVTGAAVATTIGRGTGVLYQLYILFRGDAVVQLQVGDWWPDWDLQRRLGRIASSGAMQYIIASASWIFLMRIVSEFGSEAVAGYTIAIRLIIFTLLPAWGLSNATATLVGQNLGGRAPERARQSVMLAAWLAGGFLGMVSIAYLLLPATFIRFFDTTPTVVAAGTTALTTFAYGYPLYGFGMILTQAFNGAGDTRTPMLINVVAFWLTEIPLGYFLGLHLGLGVSGVTWAVIIGETVLTLLALVLFRRGRWMMVEV